MAVAVLNEEFLYELYGTAFENEKVGANVAIYMDSTYLPNKHFQKINNLFKKSWDDYKELPTYGVISQQLGDDTRCIRMLNDFKDNERTGASTDALLNQFEKFIVGVKTKHVLEQCVKAYGSEDIDGATELLSQHYEWKSSFSLKPSGMVDVFGTFKSRYESNKSRAENNSNKHKPVFRFYIDEIDRVNDGRSLRSQLTLVLASSGVGKSHYARYIGLEASLVDGLDVLHVQLEGTSAEVTDAYSAAIADNNAYEFETGALSEEEIEMALQKIEESVGTLMVKSFSKFGDSVSTLDIRQQADSFRDAVGKYPDIIIIDSMDLLTDYRKTKRAREELRHIRLAVAEDLKNIAMDIESHIIATYQATIESKATLDSESEILTRYNISEAKGLVRPATNLLTLNQTDTEKFENSMRVYVDKARFFDATKCGNKGVVNIKCNYDKGQFYDSEATLRLVGLG